MQNAIYVILLCGIMMFSAFAEATAKVIEHTLIVKFNRSTEYEKWINSGRKGEIPVLKEWVGRHDSRGFIADNFFTNIDLKADYLLWNNKLPQLARIAVIEYSADYDPTILAGKISHLDCVEYAEPMYERKFVGAVNDTLAGEQYYLNMVHALDAQDLIDSQDTITIGVVDTGVYYEHEDLHANMYFNPGETGTDENGNQKESNGIDDDENGFVDDYHGWDFIGVQNSEMIEDNDPHPGHAHGTHVAGTIAAMSNNKIGIAGVAKNVKILPVKIGEDYSGSVTTLRGMEGILYAAKMGAKIINCSWGGDGYSWADQDVIDYVTENGSLVIAAAGNDAVSDVFYPAGYRGVLCVGAIDKNWNSAYFTNYGYWVDIASPGVSIMSTEPYNIYGLMSGTSMATPVTVGVAALVKLAKPDLTPLQLGELLKFSANRKIYDENIVERGMLGAGVVDAMKAIKTTNFYGVNLSDYSIKRHDESNPIAVGDEYFCDLTVQNVADEISDLRLLISPADDETAYCVSLRDSVIDIGKFEKEREIDLSEVFGFEIVEIPHYDQVLKFQVQMMNGEYDLQTVGVSILVNNSYLDIENDILLSANSRGNIAFNDFPTNTQGAGFKYNGSNNLLYEGSTMLYLENTINQTALLFDVARSEHSMQNNGFSINRVINESILNDEWKCLETIYDNDAKIELKETIFAGNNEKYRNMIFVQYEICNKSIIDYQKAFVGMYCDWDIGVSGRMCNSVYYKEKDFAYNYSTVNDLLPYIGAKSISQYPTSFYGFLNADESDDGIGVYNGFTDEEKVKSLTSGIENNQSEPGDISQVIGAGPFELKAGETKKTTIAFFVGKDLDELTKSAENADDFYEDLLASSVGENFATENIRIFPSPATSTINVAGLPEGENFNIKVIDLSGNCVITGRQINDEKCTLGVQNLPAGVYYLKLWNKEKSYIEKFIINR